MNVSNKFPPGTCSLSSHDMASDFSAADRTTRVNVAETLVASQNCLLWQVSSFEAIGNMNV